jgi:hypothetical protein
MPEWKFGPQRATPRPPPYHDHRTMSEVLADERRQQRREQILEQYRRNLRQGDPDPQCPN